MRRQLRLILTLKCRLNPVDSVKRLKSFESTWQMKLIQIHYTSDKLLL